MENEVTVTDEIKHDNDAVSNVSFTELSRQMFNEDIKLPWYESAKRHEVDEGLDSIYEIASANHLP